MTKNAKGREPLESKIFTAAEITRGIAKLERRMADLDVLDPREVTHDEGLRDTVRNSIRDTVRDVFGANSQEAGDFVNPELYHSDGIIRAWDDDNPAYDYEAYGRGIPQMRTRLGGLVAKLEEKRLDLEESPEVHAYQLLQGMRIHPRIFALCSALFRDGHHSQAVFDASKALINFVKEKSGRHDLDGVGLMTEVFSPNKPILRFNDLVDQSDKDEQQGMMHLFMGAALAVRNPRGHSFPSDSPDEAVEFIGFLSLLASRLDKTRK